MAQKSASGNISGEEARKLFRQIADIIGAMADGRVTVDGQTLGENPEPVRDLMSALPVFLRGDGQVTHDAAPAIRPATQRNTPAQLKPRRVYELVPQKKAIDTEGLTPAAVAIVKFLSTRERATIREIMEILSLRRSTVANSLTELKRRKVVKSMNLMG